MTPEELLKGLRRFETDESLKKKLLFLVDEWRRMFPELKIQEQIQYAHYWLMKKAEEIRKTKPVFGHPVQKYVEQKPNDEEVMTDADFAKMREAIRDPKRSNA